jgi:hypothetical protein
MKGCQHAESAAEIQSLQMHAAKSESNGTALVLQFKQLQVERDLAKRHILAQIEAVQAEKHSRTAEILRRTDAANFKLESKLLGLRRRSSLVLAKQQEVLSRHAAQHGALNEQLAKLRRDAILRVKHCTELAASKFAKTNHPAAEPRRG